MNYHTVTLPNGQIAERQSDTRTYTHACVVVITEAYRTAEIEKAKASLDKARKAVADFAPLTTEDIASHDALVAAKAQADAEMKGLPHSSPEYRVLADQSRKLFDQILNNRVHQQVRLESTVTCCDNNLEAAEKIGVGKCFVTTWSMNAKNGQAAAAAAQKSYPLCIVFSDDKVAVRTSKVKAEVVEPETIVTDTFDAHAAGETLPADVAALVEEPTICTPAEMAAEAAEQLVVVVLPKGETATCPKCKATHPVAAIEDEFGWRKVNGKQVRQSYCRKCRGSKKEA